LWITLTEPQSWLYSTPNAQEIHIKCKDYEENKITITGKITLGIACKLTTVKVTLKTKQRASSRLIETHLPEFNLTLTRENKIKIKPDKDFKLKQVIKDPSEFIDIIKKKK